MAPFFLLYLYLDYIDIQSMTTRLTSIFVSSLLILTMVSSCKKGDIPFIRYTANCPINAEINGTLFTSENYISVLGQIPSTLTLYPEYFFFSFQRNLTAGENTVKLTINVEDSSFELNKKYPLSTKYENSYGQVIFTQNGEGYEFVSTDGYIVFTNYQVIGGTEIVSGHFEFTAVDSDKNLAINITDGTFENLVG